MLFINILLSLVLVVAFVQWRSPLILFAAQFTLGAIFRTDDASFFINLAWFSTLIIIGFSLNRMGMRLDKMSLKFETRGFVRPLLFAVATFSILALWIYLLGVEDLSSEKRQTEDAGFGNIVDIVMLLALMLSVTIMAFWRRGDSKAYLYAAIMVLLIVALRAFLGSNRGLVLIPIIFLFATRFITTRRQRDLAGFITFSAVTLPLVVLALIMVTADRAGVGMGEGVNLLITQLSSPLSNGYSPMKDRIIIDYVDIRGPMFPLIMLISPIYALIPSFLWPGKPDVGAGRIIGVEIFGTGGGVLGRGAGIPISIPAHFEAILGPGGFAMGLIAFIVSCVIITLLARRWPIAIIPLAVVGHNAMGSDIGRLGLTMMMMTAGLIAAQKVLGFRLALEASPWDTARALRRIFGGGRKVQRVHRPPPAALMRQARRR